MKTIVINENQRGLLFKNGKYKGLLGAGKYSLFSGRSVQLQDISMPVSEEYRKLLENDADAAAQLAFVTVGEQQIALHYVNGVFRGAVGEGRHAFWSVFDRHEFRLVDISAQEIGEDIPVHILEKLNGSFVRKYVVEEYEKGILFRNSRMVKELEPGVYYFWNNEDDIAIETVDTRRCSLEINGQSILTKDKVELRITFMVAYKVTDCVKRIMEIQDFERQLYIAAQLALRELAAKYRVDELLEVRERLSAETAALLGEKAKCLYAEIEEAGIRDIILPGEISSIMNTVLAAEKRAQASVITRREEVASTRSLLNTAKLMDENKTLYKLKELEYIERICENVGSITVDSGKGLLSQLCTILTDK